MLSISRILVPIDFTETSDKAFDFAIELAAKFSASITVMHAFEIPVIGFPDGALVATADIAARIQEAGKQGLDAAVKARQGGPGEGRGGPARGDGARGGPRRGGAHQGGHDRDRHPRPEGARASSLGERG